MEARNADGPLRASITALHGFLTSVVSGPIIMPSEWIPVVFGGSDDDAWDSMEEAQRAMGLLMGFYNEIASDLRPGGRFSILIDQLGEGDDAEEFADEWVRGYLLGTSLRADAWKRAMDDRELARHMMPFVTIAADATTTVDPLDREHYDTLVDLLPECALAIRDWWRARLGTAMQDTTSRTPTGTIRRSVPKVPANAPCSCGSGKKFKRCCSTLRAL